MFVRCAPSSGYTQLFSHGKAVDLGQTSGKPSEKNLYADINAAWQALRTRYGVSPENIILYGQSIGTVPTVHLASSIDKISKVTSPVLVIHGTKDEVIDFSHGLAMYERCSRAVEPLWVKGAGHNDIELYAQYLERLKQFISHELPNS
ncbi:hypothetical protein E2I00_001624 [Balaenoptera physalus]|uniref:Alpha/beta hydrolase domain-containing protein 17C n=1 Tax=Balaenoptera physalus TaxID=9770 RepID=A0A643CDX0_BALPH|nr:hypothetical protein E2I00_001624 [Balaenoptera physalus]